MHHVFEQQELRIFPYILDVLVKVALLLIDFNAASILQLRSFELKYAIENEFLR